MFTPEQEYRATRHEKRGNPITPPGYTGRRAVKKKKPQPRKKKPQAARGKTGLIYTPEAMRRIRAAQANQEKRWAGRAGAVRTSKLTPEKLRDLEARD